MQQIYALIVFFAITILCLPLHAQTYEGSVQLSSQDEIDAFGAEGYKVIIGDVLIGETSTTNLISDVSPLESIEEIRQADVNDNLQIRKLTGINGELNIFPKLQLVEGDITIDAENAGYSDLAGFDRLETIGGDLNLRDIAGLTDISGFATLEAIGGFFFLAENPTLTQVTGFTSLREVGEELAIFSNANLTDLSGFTALEILRQLSISENQDLSSIQGFDKLSEVSENINISACPSLTSINGFNELDSLYGSLVLTDLSLLESITGFTGWVHQAVGDLSDPERSSTILISECPRLITIVGLRNLRRITAMNILGSNRLETLSGLCSIEEITGLPSVTPLINITASRSLTDCYALCPFTPFTEYILTGGSGDCSDALTLDAACDDDPSLNNCETVLGQQFLDKSQFTISPNPTSSDWNLSQSGLEYTYTLYDLMGTTHYRAQTTGDMMIPGSKLAPGTYVLQIQNAVNGKSANLLLVKAE